MKKISFKAKTTILITLLTAVICLISIAGLLAMSKRAVDAETQQLLISAVERNTDAIEYKNGILEIENDFAFYSDGVYCDIYDENHAYIEGGAPLELIRTDGFTNGEITTQSVNGKDYYVYNTRLDFNSYEYEIDVFSGHIISYEADSANTDLLAAAEINNLIFDNGISTQEAIDIALAHAGAAKDNSTVFTAELQAHENRQIFLIEFSCTQPLYGSIWIRGLIPSNIAESTFGTINRTIIYLIPILIAIAAIGAYILSRSTIKPVEDISRSAKEISSGRDLSKRIEIKSSSDEISTLSGTFNQMLERLQTSFESEKQFTSDASHELRTPLAVIKAECEYALSENADDEDKTEALSSINEQTDKMTRLVSSLLSLTRTEQGTQRFTFENTDLSELVQQVCKGFAPKKGITVNTSIEKDIYFDIEVSLISRMLENLLSNASRYGRENGYINVSLNKFNNKIILSVKDNGIGIKEDDLPKIFGRFYRSDSSRSNSDGFGLGLALVDRIVSLHSGKTEVKSVFGEGSEFIITFFEKY